ncbi:MAG: gliding motility lipoprotein GldD, partial [Flavobacteriaceae bacterium]|nr:gliding motility lipoprotein GldD [Flavobacteriaceae bacterium]
GYLRLEYPAANYMNTNVEGVPFSFESNTLANKIVSKKITSTTESYAINIEYPTLKGTIYLTYKSISNNRKNLIDFLKDAQNFTQKHTAKADEIKEKEYINKLNKVYGMFYEVGGNAASQSQFYVTDSTEHFLTGSLYFYAKPNYDSILPAAKYLEKDIKRIMETVKWK